ncbi:MAG: hypothetical protein AB1420_14055 [Bacillota bacterium]
MQLKQEYKYSGSIYGFLLSLGMVTIGLAVPRILTTWMPRTSPGEYSSVVLFLAATAGMILGIYAREYYRYLIAKMLGLQPFLFKQPRFKTVAGGLVSRWQAVSISVAPLIDMTLLSLVVIFFSKSWLIITWAVTFLSINLLLSAKDLIISFFILKFAHKYSMVEFTNEGFKVWENG